MKIILTVLLSAFAHLAGAADVNTLMPIPNRGATVTLQTGVQLVAGRYREDILLAAAAILDKGVPFRTRRNHPPPPNSTYCAVFAPSSAPFG